MSKMKIGIIRWDAYFKTGESDSFVSDQVARALSPAEYHDRVPFFASIRSDGRVEFPEYTQQIWERETDYAVDAGFDYYAYCWYRTKDPLSLARRFHAASKNPGRIKMAAILGVTKEDEQTIDDLFACMKQDYYLKLADGTPVVFGYGETGNGMGPERAEEIRAAAEKAGIPRLYLVKMASFVYNTEWRAKFTGGSYDAVSFYGLSVNQPDTPYQKLAEEAEFRNKYMAYCYQYNDTGLPLIPTFTAGRDQRPRIDNPTTWAHDYKGYSLKAEEDEIGAHVYRVLCFAREYADCCPTGLCHGYAWNEHDEGAGICPTIEVDENGWPCRDGEGNLCINARQLEEVKRYIQKFKNED